MHYELQAPRGEPFTIRLALGADTPHESSAMHHIRWIRLYFLSDDAPDRAIEAGSFRFAAHGAAGNGEHARMVSAGDSVQCTLSLEAPGRLYVLAYCSMHGFMEREFRIRLEEYEDYHA